MIAPGTTTTLRTLLRNGAALLVLTVVTGGFAWWAFDRAHDTAQTAQNRTVPAIMEVSAARSALIQADHAAILSFHTGAARFGGPGEEYRNQLAIATQNLTRAAEDNVTGNEGSQRLRFVQGQLASYLSLVEQAAAIYRQNENAALWMTDLWNASRLLHDPEAGVLAELHALQGAQRERLTEELDSGDMVWSGLSWLLPAILLFGLLGVTQVYLTRRFRRVMNPGLLVAALCLLGLVGVTALTFNTYRDLVIVRDAVHETSDDSSNQAAAIDEERRLVLAELMRNRCGGECGYTVDAFIEKVPNAGGLSRDAGSAQPSGNTEDVTEVVRAAGDYRDYAFLVPLGVVLVLGPIAAGLYFHIDKYRYRAR
ncbi:MAG: hypothetical protein ACRDSL_12895 [Pseudonocardiaceae bacterium]